MMKTLILCILVINSLIYTQWEPDIRLTNSPGNSATSFNNARNIVANGNILHIIWQDTRDGGNPELYYKRSTNSGLNWFADVRLTNHIEYSEQPTIACLGQVLHVVWEDNRSDNNLELFYKRSTDDGVTWGTDTRLTINNATSVQPSVAASDSVVHIVWQENRDGNWEVYYKRSTDIGNSWSNDVRLTSNSSTSAYPTVTVFNSQVHIVWYDVRDGNPEIYYKRSTDNGLSWSSDYRLTNNSVESYYATISVTGSIVHVIWEDMRDGNYEIYYKRSTDAGLNWSADARLTNNSSASQFSSIVSTVSCVHIVWQDNRDGNWETYYKQSTNSGSDWNNDVRLTNNSSASVNPSVSYSLNAVFTIWCDNRDGNNEIYFKRDLNGNPTGHINLITETPINCLISQNYPNPFNPTTMIRFDVAKTENVTIKVFDMLGKDVATLVNQQLNPGTYETNWDASGFSSGIYYYKIISGNFIQTKKMVLVK